MIVDCIAVVKYVAELAQDILLATVNAKLENLLWTSAAAPAIPSTNQTGTITYNHAQETIELQSRPRSTSLPANLSTIVPFERATVPPPPPPSPLFTPGTMQRLHGLQNRPAPVYTRPVTVMSSVTPLIGSFEPLGQPDGCGGYYQEVEVEVRERKKEKGRETTERERIELLVAKMEQLKARYGKYVPPQKAGNGGDVGAAQIADADSVAGGGQLPFEESIRRLKAL